MGGRTYLDGGKALNTLFRAQVLVLLVITVYVVERDEGVNTQCCLAELRCHSLTVLWNVVTI